MFYCTVQLSNDITHECQQCIYIVNAHLMKVFYFLDILSFSAASQLSLGVRVYILVL